MTEVVGLEEAGETAFVYFARMLFCSLKNSLPYSLADCSPDKMPGEHFTREYMRSFLRDQEGILSKMLYYILLKMSPS